MNESSPGARVNALAALAISQTATVERAEAAVEAAKAALQRTLTVDLPELMKELGLPEVTLPDGKRVTLSMGIDISIPEAARPAAYQWMADRGYGALVRSEVKVTFGAEELERAAQCVEALAERGWLSEFKMSVPPPTLKAWARERMNAQEDLPPELFNVRAYDMARISQPKGKR